MRLIFFPALALSLLGAWLLPGGDKDETWSGPVVLNRAPPPPSDAAYREAYLQAWAPAYLPPAAPSSTAVAAQAPAQTAEPAIDMAAYAINEDAKLRSVISQDIARMKALGIGMQSQQPAADEVEYIG